MPAVPAETRMFFRIGINLGDVIAEGDDIYGDGVNIAARLQASAPAGGIVISNTVYDQVRNKMSVGFEFLGDLNVKNIEERVPSYAVRIGGQESNAAPITGRNEIPAPAQGSPRDVVKAGFTAEATISRKILLLALIALALAVMNILSWNGTFWAVWPALAFATVAGLAWARRTSFADRWLASAGVVAGASAASICCPGKDSSGRCGRCSVWLLPRASAGQSGENGSGLTDRASSCSSSHLVTG